MICVGSSELPDHVSPQFHRDSPNAGDLHPRHWIRSDKDGVTANIDISTAIEISSIR